MDRTNVAKSSKQNNSCWPIIIFMILLIVLVIIIYVIDVCNKYKKCKRCEKYQSYDTEIAKLNMCEKSNICYQQSKGSCISSIVDGDCPGCTDNLLLQTFNDMGCPTRSIKSIAKNWLGSDKNNVLTNMYQYCDKVNKGTADANEKNICCGDEENCEKDKMICTQLPEWSYPDQEYIYISVV